MGVLEFDDGDAGAAKAHILVVVVADGGDGAQVLAYGLAQGAGAGAVEDAHAGLVELYGVVDKVLHGLDGLVGTHAAHVYLAFEVELAAARALYGGGADKGGGFGACLRLAQGARQTFQRYGKLHRAKGHGGLGLFYLEDGAGIA